MSTPVKVLVAEDDPDDQDIFITFLGDRNDLQILPFAKDGIELINALNRISLPNHLPDLIILDQNMPKQNGQQTLVKLKSDPRYCNIPVIIYSTYINDLHMSQFYGNGAALVVSKPSNKTGYQQMIDELLKITNS